MALTSATDQEFALFLTKYGYSITGSDDVLLALSFTYLSALPFVSDVEDNVQIKEGQMFIAYAIDGGEFNPAAVVSDKTLIEESLGRSAIVEKYQVNSDLSGTDAVSLLKRLPFAYALLAPYLAYTASSSTHQAGVYVV